MPADTLSEFASWISRGLVDRTLDTCSRWAEHRVWLPKPYKGPFTFDRFPWSRAILDCETDFISVRKASQMGFSVNGMIKALFNVIEKREDVLYVLPTAGLVGDFTKGRLDPLVADSPDLQGIWTESNVGFKHATTGSSLYIRGSVSERNLVSMPLGVAVIDEFDRCSRSTMALVWKRFSAREQKHLFALSTPTLPEQGIDEQFKLGTREHFMFECPCCSRTTELVFPECVEICGEVPTDPDVDRSFYKCKECGGRLPHETKLGPGGWASKGRWEKTQNAHGHRSFWIPGLYSPGLSAADIVRDYLKGEVDERAKIEFYNQTRGLPYIMAGGKVTPELINNCIDSHRKTDPRPEYATRMICMGIDVGSYLDVVVGEYLYTGDPGNEPHLNSVLKVLFEGRLAGDDFKGLDMLMEEFQVLHACIDSQPETNQAKAFARRMGCVSLVQYRKGTSGHEIKLNEDDDRVPILTVNRTAFFDMSLGRIHKGKNRILFPQDISGVFKEHLQVPSRTYQLDEYGNPQAVYVTPDNRADHGAHALLYCEVAHFRAYSRKTGRAIKAGEQYHSF